MDKTTPQIRQIALAVLLVCSGWAANADVISTVCEANGATVCGGTGAPTIAPSGVLTIRGYAFDPATLDSPVDPANGFVVLRNEDTLQSYKIPIQRIEARPDVILSKAGGDLTPTQYLQVNIGFIAQVFAASLPPGYYTVQDAKIQMKNAGMISMASASADQKGRFILSNDNSPFQLVGSDGTSIPLKMTPAQGGIISATGYPALQDGNYQIKAALPGLGGDIVKTVSFAYKRPVLNVQNATPLVSNFPGQTQKIAPINPLNNKPLNVDSLPITLISGGTTDGISINGSPVQQGSAINLAGKSSMPGVYSATIKDDLDGEGNQALTFWVNLPDAPNIVLNETRWDPANKIQVSSSKSQAAIKVEDVDVQATLGNDAKSLCSTLKSYSPGTLLAQTNGVNCAIQFQDIPDGIGTNPYASNALTGALPALGENKIKFTPGVIYTDPNTKQTAFYPSKSDSSSLSITGVDPSPIALTFTNDKTLNSFYAQNGGQYPGKNFALVDLAQARSLGVVNVKGGYRQIMTRVTYPDSSTKEALSSTPENYVPLVMQATEPWQSYQVKVESWYQKAPEYKTEQTFEFIGVPQGPVVNLENAFQSDDKSNTIIHGQIGMPKGSVLQFDKAAMGKWQVSIKEDKTGIVLSPSVEVADDGTFAIDMGILSVGTRYIVADARMIDASGNVTAGGAVSKPRALITSSGSQIEATLGVRSTSGLAPFSQTISANLKDSKLVANLKGVYWEYQQPDGTWSKVMRDENTQQTGINFTAQLKDVGSVAYRAVLVNKYSGASYTTDPITLTAFDVPTFTVSAPGVVEVGHPVTLSVVGDPGYNAVYSWRIITTGGYQDVGDSNGVTFTFTPTEIKNYAIEVTGKSASAPDNPSANVKKTIGIKAVNPLIAKASITGPTYVETGKTYAYKAVINDVVPSSATKSYQVLGYWILPDGSRVDGTELQYTPGASDKLLSFYTYVDGYQDQTAVTTYPIKTWTYVWPSNWKIQISPQQLDVPATIKYSVVTPDFDLRSLNGEPLTYQWSLPQGISKASGNDVAGLLTVNQQGTYQLALQVSDTRGNVVNVTSDEFTILPPATVQTQASIISKYGQDFYAPGTYYVGLKILGMPRGDSFLRNDVLINGAKVGEFTGSGNYISFSDPGDYDVLVRTITKGGNYGEQLLNVSVKPAPQPTCDLKQSMTTSGLLITPNCTVPVGYIQSYTWTYTLDGVEQKQTGKTFVVAKSWITGARVSNLALRVDTDLGATLTQAIPLN